MGDPETVPVAIPPSRAERSRGQDSVQSLVEKAKERAVGCLEKLVGPRPRTANLEPKGTRRSIEQLIDILKEMDESL